MRPFKFRNWNGEEFNYFDITTVKRFPLGDVQQFTGLFDKNGSEIWEGDIIVFPNRLSPDGSGRKEPPERNIVTYSADSDWIAGIWLVNKFAARCKVIGNVYEHPEKAFEQD